MASGFGAAFGGMMLLAVVTGMALFLSLSLLGILLSRRRGRGVPRILRYLSIVVVIGVILTGSFSVIALVDEAAPLATVFLAIVFVPLGAVGLYLRLVTNLPRLDTVLTMGVAWGLPFLVGLPLTFGLPILINRALGLAPAESRHLGVYWIAPVVGAIVVVLGSLGLARQVRKSLFTATSP